MKAQKKAACREKLVKKKKKFDIFPPFVLLESGQTRGTPCLSGPVTPPPASGAHIPIVHDGIVSPQRNWGEITRAQHKRCIFTKNKKLIGLHVLCFFFRKTQVAASAGSFAAAKER